MKLTIISMLLGTVLLSGEAEVTEVTTRQLEFGSSNPHTVVIDSDLFTVSYYNIYNEIYFNLTSTVKNYKSCKIPLDKELPTIRGRIKAAPFSSKIIVWGVGGSKSSGNNTLTNYTFFLIDPRACNYQALPSLVDKVPNSYYFVEPEVVTHQDTFDVFYASQTECSPCSFDLRGNKINVTQQLEPQVVDSQFYVRAIGKSNYAVVYPLLNESFMLTLFEKNFSAVGSQFLDPKTKLIGAAINSVENESYVGIISAYPKHLPKIPIYTVFDSKLNFVFETYPPLLDNYDIDYAFANIDRAGNSYLTLFQKEKRGPNWKITMVRYNAKGRLVHEVILGNKIHMGVEVDYKEQAVVIGEKEYCLVVHTRRGFKPPTERTNIKCIDVSGRA